MNWSEHQQRIFGFIENDKRSAVIIAVAGSGKTTTIVEGVSRTPSWAQVVFVAFNKSIATELSSRLPKRNNVRAMTLNAMGYSAWTRFIGGNARINVDSGKTRAILTNMLPQEEVKYAAPASKLVALAKSVGIVPSGMPNCTPITYDMDSEWLHLIDKHDIEVSEDMRIDQLIEYSREALRRGIESANITIDFDDQLYMPVIKNAPFFKNDIVFVDEAQDVNKIQRAMLRRALKPNGRLIAVGDPGQAIYGFRGADSDAIENIKKEFNAVELPLTVSYRCPTSVVTMAQQFVSHIEAAPGAPSGEITHYGKWGAIDTAPGDFMLCRSTAPLVATAYKLIRNKVACHVMGREIGAGLVDLVKKMKAKGVDHLRSKLDDYRERETAALIAKGQETKAGAIDDKVETVMVFIDMLDENNRTIPELIRTIEALFSDHSQESEVKLMTVHKAKGHEAKRVWILDWFRCPSKYARQEWQIQQETNLMYVAVTRSKDKLIFADVDNYDVRKGKE